MEVYEYQTLNEVPVPWRTYKSARLSLNQINEIMKDAAENSITADVMDLGGARRRFSESHEIVYGFWVIKEAE
jgi:hypothetical protein